MRTRLIFAAAALGHFSLAGLLLLVGEPTGVVIFAPNGLLLGILASRPHD